MFFLIYWNVCSSESGNLLRRLKGKNKNISLRGRIIIHLREWRLIDNYVPLVGKSKEEEEGRERRDKKWKNATGDGTALGDRIPSSYQSAAFKLHCSFLCLSGARSLAGNYSGDPNPVAVWLTIYFNPVMASRVSSAHLSILCLHPETQTAGLLCWHALLLAGTAFVMTSFNRKCVLIGGNTAETMDMLGSQCNVEPNRSMPSRLY